MNKMLKISALLTAIVPSIAFGAGDTMLVKKYPYMDYRERNFYDHVIPMTDDKYIQKAVASGELELEDILRSIEKQSEMKQWIDKNKPKRFIVISMTAFRLYLFENKGVTYDIDNYQMIWHTNIVIGSKAHQTPMENFKIQSLKYNPTWTPTPRMVRNLAKKNGEWNRKWIDGHDLKPYYNGKRITLEQADKYPVTSLTFVQPPSDNNALGRLKFETTSTKMIYLHDTNEKELFNHATRAYSSGCIRVENPFELAAILANTTVSDIESEISTGKTHWEDVKDVPVYFLYDSVNFALGDDHDNLKVLPDVYNKF